MLLVQLSPDLTARFRARLSKTKRDLTRLVRIVKRDYVRFDGNGRKCDLIRRDYMRFV